MCIFKEASVFWGKTMQIGGKGSERTKGTMEGVKLKERRENPK